MYLIFSYLLGIFLGFLTSPFNKTLLGILKNIIPLFLIILLQELSRYIILSKGNKNKTVIILSYIIFVLFDVCTTQFMYDFSNKMDLFDFIVLILLPSLSKNTLLTYMSIKAGYKPCILYQSIMELYLYIIPIYTNLGDYLNSIFKMIFPLILLYRLYLVFTKVNNTEIKKSNKPSIISIILFCLLTILVALVSNYFKYYILVIASGSMQPNLMVGDAVILEKLSTTEQSKLKVGDILVYQYEKKIIVHRIVDIQKLDNNNNIYRTKGDNNKDKDNWIVYANQVIGVARFKIRYIGYPSVLLNKYLNS